MESASRAHVKIGITSHVYARMLTLRTGVLYPIGVVLFAEVGERGRAHKVESSIHRAFRDRRGAGEWFRFDLSCPVEKQLFHAVTRTIYEEWVCRTLSWKKITPEQITAYADATKRKARLKRRSPHNY